MALPELGVPTTTVLHRIPSMGCWRQEAPGNAKDLWRLEGISGINRHEQEFSKAISREIMDQWGYLRYITES